MHKTVPFGDVASSAEGAHGSRILTLDVGNNAADRWAPRLQPCVPRFDELGSQSVPMSVWVQKYGDCRSASGHVIAYDAYPSQIVLTDQQIAIGVAEHGSKPFSMY